MYESHFGLSGSPFQLNPDPAFYFDSRGHRNALAYLKFGAHQGEGFIVVTGEIGAGKTTLVRTLLGGLDAERVVAAQVVSTQLESGELLQAILMSFGIASASTSKAQLIGTLEAFLTSLAARGRRALLIIDEAQNLKHEAVEELRMLSNFQIGKFGLLQSFLVGQPELRQLLQSKSMEQLRQRVIASCHLGPLDLPETRAYIEHRLRLVAWEPGRPGFTPDAFERIHHWAGGVPRKINRLCNRLLLGAFLNNDDEITAQFVDRTAGELRSEIGELTEVPEKAVPAKVEAEVPEPVASQEVPETLQSSASASTQGNPEPVARLNVAKAVGVGGGGASGSRDSRANVRLVQPAMPGGARLEHGPSTPAPAEITAATAEQRPSATPAPTQVAPPPVALPEPAEASAPEPKLPQLVWQTHMGGAIRKPLICLVDTAAEFLQVGALAEGFRKSGKLPSVVTLHMGAASALGFDEHLANRLPVPAASAHLVDLPEAYAERMCQVLAGTEAVFDKHPPTAVLAVGDSDAIVTSVLLARNRGIPVFRVSSASWKTDSDPGQDSNAQLINRLSTAIYLGRMDGYVNLYQDHIRSERALCVGKLVADTLKRVMPHLPAAEEVLASAGVTAGATAPASGFALFHAAEPTPDAQTNGVQSTVDVLCALGRVAPVLWPASAAWRSQVESAGLAKRLNDAQVQMIQPLAYLQQLALLRASKGLIQLGRGGLIDEAIALNQPALHLLFDLAAAPNLTLVDESSGRALEAKDAGDLWQKQWSELPPPSDSPDYWDSDVALRIANHLAVCLASAGKAKSPRSH